MTQEPKHPEESKPPNGGESRSDGDHPEPQSWVEMQEIRDRGDGGDGGDGSLADDEDEGEEEDEGQAGQPFTANVMIVRPSGQEDMQKEPEMEEIPLFEQNLHTKPPDLLHPPWTEDSDKPEDSFCVELVRLCVCVTAAAVIFPLLTWGGYKLLPFDAPPLHSPALRMVYTLRCAFFATIPIMLGVLVQGAFRLRLGTMRPLFEGTWENREVIVHSHYVRDSLHLYLLYFLQLAVMATYAQQEMLKLVPLLTIIFVFGRLIYWVCVVLGSRVRALGFSLSFLPLLVLLAANLYFIGSAGGQEAVFSVAPPTTAPPPKQRWWG